MYYIIIIINIQLKWQSRVVHQREEDTPQTITARITYLSGCYTRYIGDEHDSRRNATYISSWGVEYENPEKGVTRSRFLEIWTCRFSHWLERDLSHKIAL